MTSILLLRNDLRRHDLPALTAAHEASRDGSVVPLFVIDGDTWATTGSGPRAWLAATLEATREAFGGHLAVRIGDPREIVPDVVSETKATSVHVSHPATTTERLADAETALILSSRAIPWVASGSPYLVDPGSMRDAGLEPLHSFGSYLDRWRKAAPPAPAGEPEGVRFVSVESDMAWDVLRAARAADGVPPLPEAGEQAARRSWDELREWALQASESATEPTTADLLRGSQLAPYLALGVIHPRSILADLKGLEGLGPESIRRAIARRDFDADVLLHRPELEWRDYRPGAPKRSFADARAEIGAWLEGRTGEPFVDAVMRQLAAEGWVHDRARDVAATYLVDGLGVQWQVGAMHFLDHLVGGELATVSQGWQRIAGTAFDDDGADSPRAQASDLDPDGSYVRHWVPELRHLAGGDAHAPWSHPEGYAHGYPSRVAGGDGE